jgi:hypothetical protein
MSSPSYLRMRCHPRTVFVLYKPPTGNSSLSPIGGNSPCITLMQPLTGKLEHGSVYPLVGYIHATGCHPTSLYWTCSTPVGNGTPRRKIHPCQGSENASDSASLLRSISSLVKAHNLEQSLVETSCVLTCGVPSTKGALWRWRPHHRVVQGGSLLEIAPPCFP